MVKPSSPIVSVLIPAYNAEKYIKKAIESILSQTYKNLEIWLLDDASTDDTRKILLEYKDERIKTFFVDENTRKIGIVNEVLGKVTGEYITFQDADDWSEPDRIERQLQKIVSENELGIVFTGTDIKDLRSKVATRLASPVSDEEIKDKFFNYGKKKTTTILACATMLVKKSIIDQVGGYHPYFKGKAGSDIYWVYNILKHTNAYCIDEPLYHVMRTENSFTAQLHSIKNIKSAYIWKVISKLIEFDQKGLNLLDGKNELALKTVELEACEQSFKENFEKVISLNKKIRSSYSFRLGSFLLRPFSFIKRIIEK